MTRVCKVIFLVDCTQTLQNTYCKGVHDFWVRETFFLNNANTHID